MARLYPPNIAGTLPSFYTDLTGATKIVVPFSMNPSVSAGAVSGFTLRIKTTTTDTLVGEGFLRTSIWDSENYIVTFNIDPNSNMISALHAGNFYKIQLAYYQRNINTGTIIDGYFSTASIIKYTNRPTIDIQGLLPQGTNSINYNMFVGEYKNADASEKVSQYRFIINHSYRDETTHQVTSDNFLDTGWLIHNTANDLASLQSVDTLTLNTLLSTSVNYTIQYLIITNNGLQASSPVYQVQSLAAIGSILNIEVNAELDYENGRMKITMKPKKRSTTTESISTNFQGNYYLERTDSHSHLKNWIFLYGFQSQDAIEDFVYYDYTIESGIAYKYGLQMVNNASVMSQRSESIQVEPGYFEYSFLYDGERQLKIKFDSNVSSIKEVVSETKKTTLGSQYPFIFRNGVLRYKEFPINGTLSYLSDSDELFISRKELLHDEMFKKNKSKYLTIGLVDDTNQTDENITAERNFAMSALSWLNNGKIKLFKSPQEGNFIVKCMNTQLAPLNNTNRMIHTFSTTASEVQPFSVDALIKYEFVDKGTIDSEGHVYTTKTKSINIMDKIYNLREQFTGWAQNSEAHRQAVEKILTYDWTEGLPTIKVEFVDATAYAIYQWGEYSFGIGAHGDYVLERDTPYIGGLYAKSGTPSGDDVLALKGTLVITYLEDVSAPEQLLDSQRAITYFGWGGCGPDLTMGNNNESQDNLLADFKSNKYIITEWYNTDIHSIPIKAENNWPGQWEGITFEQKKLWYLLYGKYVHFYDRDNSKEYRIEKNTTIYQETGDQVVTYNLIEVPSNYNIRTKSPTDGAIDIRDKDSRNRARIDFTDQNELYWTVGANVCSNFFMQVQVLTYGVEKDKLYDRSQEVSLAKMDWLMKTFNFQRLNNQPSDPNTLIFIYQNEHFVQIPYTDWEFYNENYYMFTVYDDVYSDLVIDAAYRYYYSQEQALEGQINIS